MGRCAICHQEFKNTSEIEFIEVAHNEKGEMSAGIAVHPRCKIIYYNRRKKKSDFE
jgi:hypothetical protein